MKTVGWILTIVAGLIIFYNVLQSHENVKQVEEHPWTTLFSDGANLKPSFTFTPPFTPFELTVIAGGVIGVILIISGGSSAERGHRVKDAAETNIVPREIQKLREIAYWQRFVLDVVLCSVLLAKLWGMPPSLRIWGPLASIVISAFFISSVYRLAEALGSASSLLWALAMLVPVINLICLLIIIQRATSILRGAGVLVGLMGANFNSIEGQVSNRAKACPNRARNRSLAIEDWIDATFRVGPQSPVTPRGGSSTTVPSSASEDADHPVVVEVVGEVPSPAHGNADVALEPPPLNVAPNLVPTRTSALAEPNGTPAAVASPPVSGSESPHVPSLPPLPVDSAALSPSLRSRIAKALRLTCTEAKATCIATIAHISLLMRIAAIPWKIRVLGNKLSEARFHLGQKMYQEHVGDQTIIAQIAELTARMESPEPIDIGVFNRLKRDRRQLTLRLADLALAQDNSPTGLEVEYQEVVGIQAAIKALQGAAAALKPQLRPPTPVSWRRIGIGYATMVTLIIAITWALSPHRTSDTTAGAPLSKEISIDVGQGVRTPLPPEYRTLATHLTEDVKNSPDEFRDHKGMAEIIAEGHSAAMDLANIKSADADISYIASQGHEAFVEAIKHLEMIDALSKPPDADEKAKAIRAEVEGLIAAADRAEAAELPLPKVALKYAPPLAQDSTSIAIKFHESWGSIVGLYDWLLLENASGQPLEDCTIVVELTGAAGDVKKNVHFVREWPLQSWVYARYGGGKEIGGRTLGRTSVGLVQKIAVAVYSPRLSATVNYTYQGEEKDKDYAERCEKLTVRGRYRPFAGGVFSNDERAAILTLDGVDLLPKCKVTVAFVRGPGAGAAGPPEVKSWYWDLDCWKKGDEKTFATAKDQLSWDPDKIDVLIAFPNSSYEWKGTIVVR